MKSKSPFAIKSPLRIQVYGGDTYESPDTVITKTVGEQVGTAITGLADVGAKYMDLKGKLAKDESDHGKAMELANLKYGKKTSGEARLGLTTPSEVGSSFGKVPGVPDLVSKSKTSSTIKGETFTDQNAWDSNRNDVRNDKRFQGEGGKDRFFTAAQDYRDKKGTGINTTYDKGKTRFEDGKRMLAINMNGSPVKHNAGAVGSFGNADPLAGGIAGIGQQMGNQAQQRAADAGGSTGVDPFLPPPNQVAETGSYGSGGDRDMLEMNGNQINNQSIGRNTDVASQLFGSGQRASMLAMKGTPLHDKGHANDYEGHTHRKKGGSYKEGDYMDETDMET